MSPAPADARGTTERLLAAARRDDVAELAAVLATVVRSRGERDGLVEGVLAELVAAVSASLGRRAGAPARGDVFTADLTDADDEALAVDELDPALRAVLRAVLAQLNGDPDDSRFQIGLVRADPEPLSRLDALWHALLWVTLLEDADSGDG
ncbi:hypothetical protein FFT09_18410 [Saccharomonospora piscinae]|uniref:hypothetical protein n=1 Tax=Saccharomonospora piscinae TaxID=687388 RepID=UPI0011075B37|nr:hypothetical protein [Saccharomonospora piscinae]TLW91233.1 hypothetical protein FFT09_18410 [Saccharomonospora piscinae]